MNLRPDADRGGGGDDGHPGRQPPTGAPPDPVAAVPLTQPSRGEAVHARASGGSAALTPARRATARTDLETDGPRRDAPRRHEARVVCRSTLVTPRSDSEEKRLQVFSVIESRDGGGCTQLSALGVKERRWVYAGLNVDKPQPITNKNTSVTPILVEFVYFQLT